MSLRDSYFNGPNGLQQQMDAAFQAGMSYVGAGVNDLSTLDLGDRNGSNLGAGSLNPGFYFKYASPTATYAMWMLVAGEVAPSVAGATLVQVTLLVGDTSTQVAAKIAAAMNAITGIPFSAISSADVITMQNSVVGTTVIPVNVGTLGGTAAVNQVTAGVNSTGNYSTLQQALATSASQGLLAFCVLVQGTGSGNAVALRGRNGRNLYLRSFFAGILQAMADQQIYDYQVRLELDLSTNSSVNVIFHFNFGTSDFNPPVRLEPLTSPAGSCPSGYRNGMY